MAKSFRGKIIVSYCKNCRVDQEMKPVRYGFDDKIVWLKCPDCAKMIFIKTEDYEDIIQGRAKPRLAEEENYIDYAPEKSFQIGQVVYHKVWDDSGEVMKKEISSSGRHFITVEFNRLGQKTLIEKLSA